MRQDVLIGSKSFRFLLQKEEEAKQEVEEKEKRNTDDWEPRKGGREASENSVLSVLRTSISMLLITSRAAFEAG